MRGVVQGVGFRPFVFNLAEQQGLYGWVLNDSDGVEIEVEGPAARVAGFLTALRSEAPPLARIESVEVCAVPVRGDTHFGIRQSKAQPGRYQLVSPDVATCPDCQHEVSDPADRRYRYPFTNCTNCGPRFTIITAMPYDRPNTTMQAFEMCPACQREYDDPHDRRFHAQPNACPVCGPQLSLVMAQAGRKGIEEQSDVLTQAAHLLQDGAIVAIKGLGGFHLACDATNAQAVSLLRQRKRRPDKPFAVMMASLDHVQRHCEVGEPEQKLLASLLCPIVLLPWRATSDVAAEVAPRYRYLGVMLPYTPLHHLLLSQVGRPLVMTSGNLAEEPIAAQNDEALQRLGHLADAFVLHNRDICARYDDSVWFVPHLPDSAGAPAGAAPQPIRRARGDAPFPIKLPFNISQILACGAEIKNTFCLTRDEYAFVSQHIGDMENLETLEHYRQTVALYQRLFQIEPQLVAHDLHPDYLSTRYALHEPKMDLPTLPVQHHHAHLASVLADNAWPADGGPVIGVIMDGTGYGTDGQIWGGEWLVGGYHGYRRAAHLQYLPLPGGDAATRHPWRIATSYLYTLLGRAPAWVRPEDVQEAQVRLLEQQLEHRFNCPLTSSMGRLFDAAAALLGIGANVSYEAQAAIELEAAAAGRAQTAENGYPFDLDPSGPQLVIGLQPLMAALTRDIEQGRPAADVAWLFHRTVAEIILRTSRRIAEETGLHTVALSGGCFQNRLLLELTVPALQAVGIEVLLHRQVPCNDGGLSLGQATVAYFASGQQSEKR